MFGPRPQPKQPEPEPERDLTPVEELYAHRFLSLLALHIHPDDALRLIEIPDVAHEAERLYAKGCPPALIYELLKGD